jgi:hypothetical protein
VSYIRFATTSELPLVGLFRIVIGATYVIDLFRAEIAGQVRGERVDTVEDFSLHDSPVSLNYL